MKIIIEPKDTNRVKKKIGREPNEREYKVLKNYCKNVFEAWIGGLKK